MANKKKTWWKTLLWVLGGVILFLFVVAVYANHLVSTMVKAELTKPSVHSGPTHIDFKDISVNLWTGSARVDSFVVASDSVAFQEQKGYVVHCENAEVRYANILRMLRKKQLYINKVQLDGLDADVFLSDQEQKEYSDTLGLKVYQSILKVIALLDVGKVDINNASFHVRNPKSPFEIKFDSTYLFARNLRYDLRDSTFTYNDSIYELLTRHFKFVDPNGEFTLLANRLYTENEEGVELDGIQFRCNIPKTQYAKFKGNLPVMWPDIAIHSVKTTPFNLIRSILEGKFVLDTLTVRGDYVYIYRDDTYPPKYVERPLQTLLMQLKTPLKVNRIQMNLDKFTFENQQKAGKPGKMVLRDAEMIVENFQNKPLHVVKSRLNAQFVPYGGKMSFNLAMHMNPVCNWNANISIKNCKMSNFNSFIGPLMGIDLAGDINQLDARYAGDSLTAKGVFTMRYDSLRAKILPTSPVPWLAKHYKSVTNLAKGLIPKANPKKAGNEPKSYYVASERNLYKPYIIHFIQPMAVGIKQTMLGGFYASKQVKEWKKKKNNWYEEYRPE